VRTSHARLRCYIRYFCGKPEQLEENEHKRLSLYKLTATLFASLREPGQRTGEAGYSPKEISALQEEVDHYGKVRDEVKLASGDYIDLKMYEPAMRHLIDTYIRAEESEKISAFDDLSLIDLIVERGADAIGSPAKRHTTE